MAERLALLLLALVMLAVVACGAKESADPNPAADFFRLIYWNDTSFNPGPTNSSSAVTTILKPVVQSLLAVFVESNELGGAPERLAAFAEAVHGAWVSFIKSGDPSHAGLPTWPRWDSTTRPTMRLDIESAVISDPESDEVALWEGVV